MGVRRVKTMLRILPAVPLVILAVSCSSAEGGISLSTGSDTDAIESAMADWHDAYTYEDRALLDNSVCYPPESGTGEHSTFPASRRTTPSEIFGWTHESTDSIVIEGDIAKYTETGRDKLRPTTPETYTYVLQKVDGKWKNCGYIFGTGGVWLSDGAKYP